MFKLSSSPLEKLKLSQSLQSKKAGAFSCFEGWVRNFNDNRSVIALEYEADKKLCEKEANRIFKEAKEKFNILSLKCFHRIGKLKIGEMAVWVGVTAPHRDDAFKACRYVIDELKKRLPIWKKEYYTNGDSGWINCETSASHVTRHTSHVSEELFYSRQINVKEIGTNGQKKLKKSKVLVVGAGGLGCTALLSLAEAGVGTIGICDFDQVEATNLHRQPLFSFNEIGESKVKIASSKLKAFNPFIKVNEHAEKVDQLNINRIIKNYDFVLDCTDNFETKFLLNDACYLSKKTLVIASLYQWEGQIQILSTQHKGCLRCLWAKTPSDDCIGSCTQAGTIGSVPNVLGHLQALEAIKLILNLKDCIQDEIIYLNLLNYDLKKIKKSINPDCPLCGHKPTIKSIEPKPNTANQKLTISLKEISKQEMKSFSFLDVRELNERKSNPPNIKTNHHPMSQWDQKGFSFTPNKKYILFCAKGGRSLKLTRNLHNLGITNVYSLNNGVEAINTKYKDN